MDLSERLVKLSQCLCEQYDDDKVCFCGVFFGQQVTTEYVHCGLQAWVRLVESYPSTEFPIRDADPAHFNAPMADTIEVGVVRPTILGEARELPSQDDWLALMLDCLADREKMLRAIRCCLDTPADPVSHTITGYTPMGPQGGVIGGIWSITIAEGF